MPTTRIDRILELFFRALRGESLNIQTLAKSYNLSSKSISRDISTLKLFLADNRTLLGNSELTYCRKNKSYILLLDNFLSNKELFAITKILIGCKPFNKDELSGIISKLNAITSVGERDKFNKLIEKEMLHYTSINFECKSVLEHIWILTNQIEKKRFITVEYKKKEGIIVDKKLMPLSIVFSEYYYYLIAYDNNDKSFTPKHFRIDRILYIICNRETFKIPKNKSFDEGFLRKHCQFMWSGKLQKITFKFFGDCAEPILDRIPTAKIISRSKKYFTIEAEVFGNGIRMFLLSQGSLVEVLSPPSFVKEMSNEISKMYNYYKK